MLALDASGSTALLCLIESDNMLLTIPIAQRQQSRLLADSMFNLCKEAKRSWADIRCLAYIAGPGSFTGLRIAAASLNGVNTALKCPVMNYSSLAVSAIACGVEHSLWVLEDARAGEVFVGHYKHGKAIEHDYCDSWDKISTHPPDVYTGSRSCFTHRINATFIPPVMPREQAIMQLLLKQNVEKTLYAMPQYLQRSQAEKMHDKKL